MSDKLIEEVRAAWNAQADEYNQWSMLGADEQLEWAVNYNRQAVRELVEVLNIVTNDLEGVQKHLPTEDKILTNSSIKLSRALIAKHGGTNDR